MTRAITLAVAASLALAAVSTAWAQQAPCNPAVDYCLPVPPDRVPAEGES